MRLLLFDSQLSRHNRICGPWAQHDGDFVFSEKYNITASISFLFGVVFESTSARFARCGMSSQNSSKLRAVLIDLSGTLHVEDTAIPGAVDALKRLRNTNVNIKFVTNTTKESRQFLLKRLTNLGFDIKKEEIWTSLWAAKELLCARNLSPYMLVADDALEDFQEVLNTGKEHDSVVVGLAPDKFDYKHLNEAFSLILNGSPLIAIHEGRYYKRSDGLALGPGPFVKGLEFASGCKAEVIGKPSGNFFKSALGNVAPNEAIMIGDDVRDDIGGAQSLGIRGFLVQTGKYRPGDESKINPPPSQICKSFVNAVDIIIKELENQ